MKTAQTALNKERVEKFIVNAVRWFDKVNGNTYHSVRVTKCDSGVVIKSGFEYGYGDHYRQTALHLLMLAGWDNNKYTEKTAHLFERENNYPITWYVKDGLKREVMQNIA